MVDTPKKNVSEEDRDNLINRIDELETLLAQKKAEHQEALKAEETEQAESPDLPRLSVGTDGIPVLVKTVSEDDLMTDDTPSLDDSNKDDQVINDIIDKIDQEITKDLDDLILMLKDSIIDEVKSKLLKELNLKKYEK